MVLALADEDIVLCSWARNFTLTVPLSTQMHKWVPAQLMLYDGLASHAGRGGGGGGRNTLTETYRR